MENNDTIKPMVWVHNPDVKVAEHVPLEKVKKRYRKQKKYPLEYSHLEY
jgi:hypothetical protein